MIVGGFYFLQSAEAEQAKKEKEGIRYIREKTDMGNPGEVLQIYNRMIQQDLFETAVGYSFLKDLQEYLVSVPEISNESILPIRIRHQELESFVAAERKRQDERRRAEQEKLAAARQEYKKKYRMALAVCVALVVCIAAMFVITATSDNATILDYERKLIDRYEFWEEELQEREAAVKEREQALGIGQE